MPDDPEIEEMDPVLKMYMFYQWLEDHNENVEFYKHHGYLIGSFINPEAVKQLVGGNTISSSDEDFEKTADMIRESSLQEMQADQKVKKRKKKVYSG